MLVQCEIAVVIWRCVGDGVSRWRRGVASDVGVHYSDYSVTHSFA